MRRAACDSWDEDDELTELRALAANGDGDAVAQLVELAGERGDLEELGRLAAAGSSDAVDVLVEIAGEQGNVELLQRLAERGNRDAADLLAEMGEEYRPSALSDRLRDRPAGVTSPSTRKRGVASDRLSDYASGRRRIVGERVGPPSVLGCRRAPATPPAEVLDTEGVGHGAV